MLGYCIFKYIDLNDLEMYIWPMMNISRSV